MNYKVEQLTQDLFKITCFDNNLENGYLEFSPPEYNNIIIQNIKVKENFRRKGIGTILIQYLKRLAQEDYGSATIKVKDIDPLCYKITTNELIEFYITNGFQIYKDKDNGDISGTYNFKR